ncbi:endonuclease exonuclease phosphatase family protein [Apiospora saccharicola]
MHSSLVRMKVGVPKRHRAYQKEVKKLKKQLGVVVPHYQSAPLRASSPDDGDLPGLEDDEYDLPGLKNQYGPVEPGDPVHQNYYTYNPRKPRWQPRMGRVAGASSVPGLSKLALFSWNIDYMAADFTIRKTLKRARMTAALRALETATGIEPREQAPLSPQTATVVFLQGCVREDLDILAERPWGRTTTMLIDRRLPLFNVFRAYYPETSMARNALCVDIAMGAGGGLGPQGGGRYKTTRLCNTQLEGGLSSSKTPPTVRPAQMRRLAGLLKGGDGDSDSDKNNHVAAGIVAGDFHATQDYDRTLPSENGLRDAYLELGGTEESEEGHTWGPQATTAAREGLGVERARLDKVLYFPGSNNHNSDGGAQDDNRAGDGNDDDDAVILKPLRFKRFGAGVELRPGAVKRNAEKVLAEMGCAKAWVTDHFEVMAEFEVVAGKKKTEDVVTDST